MKIISGINHKNVVSIAMRSGSFIFYFIGNRKKFNIINRRAEIKYYTVREF